MSAKPMAEVYEAAKELRRKGASSLEIDSQIGSQLRALSDRSEESLERYKKLGLVKSASATPQNSANLVRILEIKTLADRVFGDEEKAEAWLRRPSTSLSGQRPADMLNDELGTAVVREMLERIDHGIFA